MLVCVHMHPHLLLDHSCQGNASDMWEMRCESLHAVSYVLVEEAGTLSQERCWLFSLTHLNAEGFCKRDTKNVNFLVYGKVIPD